MKKLQRPNPGQVAGKDTPADYTGEEAPERVLRINLCFLKYGTNDKVQGAAIFICLFLLILFLLIIGCGAFFSSSRDWLEKPLPWIQNTFILVVGMALGRSIKDTDKNTDP